MQGLDLLGAALSLLCTYYFTTANKLAWPIGLSALIANMTLYWQKAIYGSLLLEGIYFLSMIIGWYQWANPQKQSTRHIRRLTLYQIGGYTSLAVISILILASFFNYWTPSETPIWDAVIIVLGLMAQGLLCLKIMDCWILWFIVDLLIAIMHLYLQIPCHSALHWIYLGMAILGYYRWRKLYQSQSLLNNS